MSISTINPDLAQLTEPHERADRLREEAAGTGRAACPRWQETCDACELARDEASTAWTARVEAITP